MIFADILFIYGLNDIY